MAVEHAAPAGAAVLSAGGPGWSFTLSGPAALFATLFAALYRVRPA
ncbi:hypothetical protein ACBI99_24760 [Nonomuraea sp. ATR24]